MRLSFSLIGLRRTMAAARSFGEGGKPSCIRREGIVGCCDARLAVAFGSAGKPSPRRTHSPDASPRASAASLGHAVSKRGQRVTSEKLATRLKTGDEFRESLRDGREVWYRGQTIDDVTRHPSTAGGIDILAQAFDAQHDPATQNTLTYVREDGIRATKAWMMPRTPEDLRSRRECIEFLARETFGVFGRQMDMIATTQVGMAAYLPLIERHSPEYAVNILPYIEYASENNVVLAGPVADPQGWRSRGSALGRRGIPLYDTDGGGPDARELDLEIDGTVLPGGMRVMRRSPEGVWVSGAKVVGSLAPQCNEMLVSNIALPDPTPDSAIWMIIPVNSPGVRLVCREMTATPEESFHDHPITSRGEELDSLVIMEDVFVPNWRIMSLGWTEIGRHYGLIGALEHWHTLTKLCVKAELFVGVLQLVVDGIGTSHRPGVRQLVAEVIEYAQVLRAMLIASEAAAIATEGGALWPNPMIITAGRSYALGLYPTIIHRLQELAGQGPILRWSREDFDHPVLGPRLEWFYESESLSARDKNILMNLVWDLTSSSHAGRVEIFENVNGFPLPYLRERMYNDYDSSGAVSHVRRFLRMAD